MSENLPIYRIKRLKKGVYDKKKGFFVEFPKTKVILLHETEKSYLVREKIQLGLYSESFSLTERWIPKWGIEIKERVGWWFQSGRITYDKLENFKCVHFMKQLNKKSDDK